MSYFAGPPAPLVPLRPALAVHNPDAAALRSRGVRGEWSVRQLRRQIGSRGLRALILIDLDSKLMPGDCGRDDFLCKLSPRHWTQAQQEAAIKLVCARPQ